MKSMKRKDSSALKTKMYFHKVIRKHWLLLLMLLPAVLYVIVFSYIPMSGIILAFEKYSYKGGIYGSKKVGLQNFKSLMIAGKLWMTTRNTLLYNIAARSAILWRKGELYYRTRGRIITV